MPQKRGNGAPVKLTGALKKKIVEGMAQGRMLLELCREYNISRSGVWRARQVDKEFDWQFERAACNGILAFLDDARESLSTAENRDEILRYKELLRHAEWMAEKRLEMFQPMQRSKVELDGPMVVGWQIEAATVLSNEQVNSRARLIEGTQTETIDR